MKVRDYIQQFWIDEIGSLVESHPFHSFVLMSTGIEFLGKSLVDNGDEWDTRNESKNDFENAIKEFDSLKKYRHIPDLYDKLRCGLVHLGIPKIGIKLEKDNNALDSIPIVLGCRDFYLDLKEACNDAIENKDGKIKKDLDKDFIQIEGQVTGNTTTYL